LKSAKLAGLPAMHIYVAKDGRRFNIEKFRTCNAVVTALLAENTETLRKISVSSSALELRVGLA
jgi:hypothetical protein